MKWARIKKNSAAPRVGTALYISLSRSLSRRRAAARRRWAARTNLETSRSPCRPRGWNCSGRLRRRPPLRRSWIRWTRSASGLTLLRDRRQDAADRELRHGDQQPDRTRATASKGRRRASRRDGAGGTSQKNAVPIKANYQAAEAPLGRRSRLSHFPVAMGGIRRARGGDRGRGRQGLVLATSVHSSPDQPPQSMTARACIEQLLNNSNKTTTTTTNPTTR